ncbi:unnamed protein product [Bemisia tabaci]|uniref:Uncharacterized protein n=1 Tax=Bemisia tabaci TaxID=7038 RepID=A0A9P0CDY0_BEMTA|nr:unnamed protein product [Bemisia tabaci]
MLPTIVLYSLVQCWSCVAQLSGSSRLPSAVQSAGGWHSPVKPIADSATVSHKLADNTYGTSNPQAAMKVQNSTRVGVGSWREIKLTGPEPGKFYDRDGRTLKPSSAWRHIASPLVLLSLTFVHLFSSYL